MKLGAFDRTWLASNPAVFDATARDPVTGLRHDDPVPVPFHVPIVCVPSGALARLDSIGHTPGAVADSFNPIFGPIFFGSPTGPGGQHVADGRMQITLAVDGKPCHSISLWPTIERFFNGGTSYTLVSLPPPGLTDIPVTVPGQIYASKSLGLLHYPIRYDNQGDPGFVAVGIENSLTHVELNQWWHTFFHPGAVNLVFPWVLNLWDWLQFVGFDSRWRFIGEFIDAVE